jgi:hypothetical protein
MKTSRTIRKGRRSGAALAFVIIVFAVIMVFAMIVGNIVNSNTVQAKAQERDLQVYYLAQSGIDLCFASLLQQGTGGANDTLLYQKFNTTIVSPTPLTDHLVLDNGSVDLTVTAVVVNSERWVSIQAVATLAGTTTTKTSTLLFQYSNPLVRKLS